MVWSIWFGLSGGLLEVGTRVLCRAIDPTRRLYLMSRHFVWLTPLANMSLFVVLGLLLAGMTKLWPRLGGWISPRLLCALAIQPMLILAAPRIYSQALFVLALGISSLLVSLLESLPRTRRLSILIRSFPVFAALVLILAVSVVAGDGLKQYREARRPVPLPGSPNVLFVVLDTVRADRLSLYGYRRSTSPALERLARHGVRFDNARAPAPWTLASHASFFSGRWPHELDVQWLTPLRADFPLLAEYLGSRGYATAGIVANTNYCSYDTGLDRGFTYFEDYILEKLAPLRTSLLVEGVLNALFELGVQQESGPLHFLRESVECWFYSGVRRSAGSINRSVVDWLARRAQPERPFFLFINYLDAHATYKLPDEAPGRFGRKPQTPDEIRVVYDGWPLVDKLKLPGYYINMARDCYDNCLAYLDEQLRLLFDELQRRDLLDRTLVVITSDHGEGLGEHDLFDHGESLYSTELRVPLLIVPPAKSQTHGVVREVVSLHNLPATVVDLVGLSGGSPFPGHSLANLWNASRADPGFLSAAFSELPSPSPRDCNHGRSPAYRGPMLSLAEGEYVYIRNLRNGSEELFDHRDDPLELSNRARVDSLRPVLDRLRDSLSRFSRGVSLTK